MRDANPYERSAGPAAAALPSRLVAGPAALFVYGTLQFDAVLSGLIGRVPARIPAVASGWRAAALEGRVYPGLVESPGAAASGFLLTGLSLREWVILDLFEDDQYDLREVALASGARGWAYVWPVGEVRNEVRNGVRTEDWDADEFAASHLQEYAARCVRISARLAADASEIVP
ncbi:gamma-glutamylcyclotransferase family protein [Streptomyces sp. NPDC093109]|uniref:gamma-glutamylcyclotransferase family protein n=1 Tax=Streptomyces sp. NPDC093109 TaxID=3154977 RepID=UPI00344C30F3